MRRALLLTLLVVAAFALRVWFASYGLNLNRFWDERYLLENVLPIVREGKVRIERGYYPSPVVAIPPALLLMASERIGTFVGRPLPILRGPRGPYFSHSSFMICRSLHALYGALAVWVTFLVGRRMFDETTGWIAAVALAFLPPHILASGYFKPDVLVVLTTLWAFHAILRAIDRPTVARHTVVAIAIALAMSSKLTGGLVAVALVAAVAAIAPVGWQWRRVAMLAFAGISSGALFIALNPRWTVYLEFLRGLRIDYAGRARGAGMSPIEIPGRLVRFLIAGETHGLVVGAAALAGALLLFVGLFRRRLSPVERGKRLALLSFPFAFTAAYMKQTAYFKGNNFAPLLPFSCLLAGWVLCRSFALARDHIAPLRTPLAGVTAATVAALLLVPNGNRFVYRSLVPTTLDKAQAFLTERLDPGDGRLLVREHSTQPSSTWDGSIPFADQLAATEIVDQLSDVNPRTLARADGLVFEASRLEGAAAALYRAQIDDVPPANVLRLAAKPFVRRGPTLVAIARPWHRVTETVVVAFTPCVGREGCLQAVGPAASQPDELASIAVVIPFLLTDQFKGGPELQLETQTVRLPLFFASRRRGVGMLYISERFPVSPSGNVVSLILPAGVNLLERQTFAEWDRWSDDLARPEAVAEPPNAEYMIRWEPKSGALTTQEEVILVLGLKTAVGKELRAKEFTVTYFHNPPGAPAALAATEFKSILRVRHAKETAELTWKLRGNRALSGWTCPSELEAKAKAEIDVTFGAKGAEARAISYSCSWDGDTPPAAWSATPLECSSRLTRYSLEDDYKVDLWTLPSGGTILEVSRQAANSQAALDAFRRDVVSVVLAKGIEPLGGSMTEMGSDCGDR